MIRSRSMRKRRVDPRAWIAITVAVLVSISAAANSAAEPRTRVLEWQGSANSLSTVALRAGNGSLTVKAVDGDRVSIRVEVSPSGGGDDEPEHEFLSWFLTSKDLTDEELIGSIDLRMDPNGDQLDVSLRPRGRTRKSRVTERWTIELPARSALEAKLDDADVHVTGLHGGVYLRLGHGSADLDLVGGDVDAQVTVGQIEVRTQGDYRNILLRSRVGDTAMWLRGDRIEYTDPPGPGSRVSLDGKGDYRARVEVEVGDAELRVD